MNRLFHNIRVSECHFPVGVCIIFKQNSEHFDILIISNTVYGVILFSVQKVFKELDFLHCLLTLFQMWATSGRSIMSRFSE